MKNLLISRIGLTATALLAGVAIGVSIPKSNKPTKEQLITLSDSIDYIDDMRMWMIEDRANGVIPADYAEYYITGCEIVTLNLEYLDSLNKAQ